MAKRTAAPRGRPATGRANTLKQMVYCRVDEDTLQRLEAHRERLQRANPGRLTNLSEALRALMLEGLDRAEKHKGR